MFKKIISTVVLIAVIAAVLSVGFVPCSAAVVTDGENFYILGDANNDSKIDLRDLVRIKRYIADNSMEIVTVAADFDANGTLNAMDLTECRNNLLENGINTSSEGSWSGIY